MMPGWDADNTAEAAPTVIPGVDMSNEATATAEDKSQEPKRDPQAYGWAAKQSYDYEEYVKSTKELLDATPGITATRPRDWASNAAKYEWCDEYGEIGPAFPELEQQLFSPEFHVQVGDAFETINAIDVFQESEEKINPVIDFADAGLHPAMLKNVELAGYTKPTPIQAYCIPAILTDHDVVACAQTGSGKTAAFLIPTLSKLMGKAKKLACPRPNPATYREGIDPPVRAEPLLLVVCPSRELATQIFDEARRFCYRSMLRPCVLYGGGPIGDQIAQLQKGCDVLIGTPGRLCDVIDRPHVLSLHRLRYTIIDEADEMLNTDWEQELKKIMQGGNQEDGNMHYMLFSATFPKNARELAKEHVALNHIRIRVGRAGSTHTNIKQNVIYVEQSQKRQALVDLLYATPPARTIIFVNSKRTADELDDFLFNLDMPTTSFHADRTQREREDAMRAFRTGKTPIMVATGISARGLDMRSVMHIINFDLPSHQFGGISEYTHRIGRTGRIGNRGVATSFFNDRDLDLAEELTKTLMETGQEIPDFLEQYKPELAEDGELRFEADSDFDDEETVRATVGGGWGASDETAPVVAEPASAGWGASNETAPVVAKPASAGVVGWGAETKVEPPAPVAAVAAPPADPMQVPFKMSWGVPMDPAVVQKAAGWNNLADAAETPFAKKVAAVAPTRIAEKPVAPAPAILSAKTNAFVPPAAASKAATFMASAGPSRVVPAPAAPAAVVPPEQDWVTSW